MLRTSALEYTLPPELIATTAAEPRDSARLMVVSRSDPHVVEHAQVRDLGRFVRRGDRLVLNDTHVLRARLVGRKVTGGMVEGLFLSEPQPGVWVCMLAASHLHAGTVVHLLGASNEPSGVSLELLERDANAFAGWRVRVVGGAGLDVPQILERVGRTPLPPYIVKARHRQSVASLDDADRARYQTAFAATEGQQVEGAGERGSVAAPTAGLHFTPGLLERLSAAGVVTTQVTLHVGTGTFRSVETEFVEQHPMHHEWCRMTCSAVDEVMATRAGGGRVITVGTTATRTIESVSREMREGRSVGGWFSTNILITPGYQWGWTDGLFTNFHLPYSTLMAMVGAFLEPTGGVERLKALYAVAILQRYRFYSFGDAMLVLP